MNEGCGCEKRRAALNDAVPGLGDKVKLVADPIYGVWNMNSKVITYAVIFLAGVVLSARVGSLPIINKLPRL